MLRSFKMTTRRRVFTCFAFGGAAIFLTIAALPEWTSSAWSFLLLALGFSLVIFVHELGHFLAAKWADVRVDQFAIGFGRAILAYRKGIGWCPRSTEKEMNRRIDEYLIAHGKEPRDGERSVRRVDQYDEFIVAHGPSRSAAKGGPEPTDEDAAPTAPSGERLAAAEALGLGETEYRLNALPLGGYVKMLGQEDFVVDKSGELKVKEDLRSFTNKTVGQRMVIISAGVIMNLLFATVAFAVVVMVGRYQAPAVVGSVVPNSPAARAGLLPGDRILRINGEDVTSFSEMSSEIVLSNPDEPLVLDVERDGQPLLPKPRVLPEFKQSESVRQLGIGQGVNRRIAMPSIWPKDEPGEFDLRRNDELDKLVIDGQTKEFRDLGVFHRALVEARGAPVEVVVKRPTKPNDLPDSAFLGASAEVESTEARVRLQALWTPLSNEQGDTVTGSFLGLVPRLTVFVPYEGKSFDQAGAKTGDVITKIGSNAYPSYATLKKTIEDNAGREVAIEVRRPYEANQELAGRTVGFLGELREDLIAAGRSNVGKAVEMATSRAKAANLPSDEIDKMAAKLKEAKDSVAMRRWLENVDVHKLKPLVPRRPFSLFGTAPPAPVEAMIHCVDENHLVVADVIEKFGDKSTPAKRAAIPVGSVILTANGKPVRHWWELCEACRNAVGRTVDITYRVADEVRSARMAIPESISTALNLGPGTRIVKIDGQTSAQTKNSEGKLEEVALPDFRAVQAILNACISRTVQVEYVTIQGQSGAGTFTVTADNVDPWLLRIQYAASFICHPLMERRQVGNPFVAAGVGFKQAYQTTIQTVKSIEHMLFTRKVGLDKVSGPVGIFRMGTRVADSGLLNLLFFLALISANLAVLNFLPMPIVDGGLFLFLILEKIRGEPVSIKTQVATQIIGIALIATVFILVTYQDIKNWITGA